MDFPKPESGTPLRDVRRGSDGEVSSGKLLLRRRDGEFHEPAFVQSQLEVQRFHIADIWKIQTKMPSPPSTISEGRRNLLSVFVGRLQQRELHGPRLPLGIGADENTEVFFSGHYFRRIKQRWKQF